MITKKQEQLIDGWIKELEEAGYSYDEMINIFRMARVKLEAKYNKEKKPVLIQTARPHKLF